MKSTRISPSTSGAGLPRLAVATALVRARHEDVERVVGDESHAARIEHAVIW
jgi:hypothetical protein